MIRFITTVYPKQSCVFTSFTPLALSCFMETVRLRSGSSPKPLIFATALMVGFLFPMALHSSLSAPSSPDPFENPEFDKPHHYTARQVLAQHTKASESYRFLKEKYDQEQALLLRQKVLYQKAIQRLLNSYVTNSYKLGNLLDYKDPTDPHSRYQLPCASFDAQAFINLPPFALFTPLLRDHVQTFVAQFFSTLDLNTFYLFDPVHHILIRSYRTAIGLGPNDPQSSNPELAKEFAEKLKDSKEQCLGWLHQYQNPESRDKKGKDKERDRATEALGISRATLQYIIKNHLKPGSFTWTTWIDQHLLSALIPAIMEHELHNFITQNPQDILSSSDTVNQLETAGQQLDYWAHLKGQLESSSASPSAENVFSDSGPSSPVYNFMTPLSSAEEDLPQTPDSLHQSSPSEEASERSSSPVPEAPSFSLLFENPLYTAHPPLSPSPLEMKPNNSILSVLPTVFEEQPLDPDSSIPHQAAAHAAHKEQPIEPTPTRWDLFVQGLLRALSIPTEPNDFTGSPPPQDTEDEN